MHTHNLNESYQTKIKWIKQKRDVTTFATHCRLKIQLFSYTYAHFTHRNDLCILSSCVCARPQNVSIRIQKHPHTGTIHCHFGLHCGVACHACMHSNNDRTISTWIYAGKKLHPRQKNKSRIYFVSFIFCVCEMHGMYGSLHTFYCCSQCHLSSSSSSSSLSSISLLLWYIQRKDSEIKKKV